jgi:tRNA pseudouridine38-40 synthase
MTQEAITLNGAGRTDAGVHAHGMVASFRTNSSINCQSFLKGLNSLLPRDIRIRMVEDVAAGFHARFSCVGKKYRYQFSCEPIILPTRRLYWAHFPGVFNKAVAQRCLDLLVGEHDFSSFEAMGSRDLNQIGGRGAVRTIFKAELEKKSTEGLYFITVAGDGFLRHMVRNIAGTVIETAQGKRTLAGFADILVGKDRSTAGATAPANGLVLDEVFY